MSEEKKEGEKVQCKCGSVVFVKNMSAHQKTKKHITAVGGPEPPKPTRSSGYVNFAAAQEKKYVRDKDDSDNEAEGSEDDEGFEEDVIESLEDIEKHLADQIVLQNEIRNTVTELRSAVSELKNSISNICSRLDLTLNTQERANDNMVPRNAKERL